MSSHSHSHDHGVGTAAGKHRRRLMAVLGINAGVLVLQVIGGLVSGSLALLADAGHMLTDSTGLIIALVAVSLAARPATSSRTFGLQRVEILAALTNGLLLVGVAVWVLIQAVDRWSQPEQVDHLLFGEAQFVGDLHQFGFAAQSAAALSIVPKR